MKEAIPLQLKPGTIIIILLKNQFFSLLNKGEGFILKNLMNYPNPFLQRQIYSAEHNRPDENIEVTITIFDMSGREIRILKIQICINGYRLAPVIWDGNNEGGKRVGRGIYPYRITVKYRQQRNSTDSGRMIIL